MFKPIAVGALLLVSVALGASPLRASEIGNSTYTGNIETIWAPGKTSTQAGQSFMAVDPSLTSIGFVLSTNSDGQAFPAMDFKVDLYEGEGQRSSLLASRSFLYAPPANLDSNDYKDIDFGGVDLNVGRQYTFFISTNSTNITFALAGLRSPYSQGSAYRYNSFSPDAIPLYNEDLLFRVRGTNGTAVPGPIAGSGLPTILAIGAIVGLSKLRRSRAA